MLDPIIPGITFTDTSPRCQYIIGKEFYPEENQWMPVECLQLTTNGYECENHICQPCGDTLHTDEECPLCSCKGNGPA